MHHSDRLRGQESESDWLIVFESKLKNLKTIITGFAAVREVFDLEVFFNSGLAVLLLL